MKIQTNTATNTRRSINKILNMILEDKIDVRKANAILYGCNISLNALKTIDLENRIEEIEDILNGQT